MIARIVAVLVALAGLAGVPVLAARYATLPRVIQNDRALSNTVGLPTRLPSHYAGVVADSLNNFDVSCSCRPNTAVAYVSFGSRINLKGLRIMIGDGATPILELEPFGTSLTKIVSGSQDAWLKRYVAAVRTLHDPVLMSFAPEANGGWYTWGYHHVPPALFIRAWRHVVTIVRQAGLTNARWVWIVNAVFGGSEPINLLWPGRQYVDLLGTDGYFRNAQSTFGRVFGQTVNELRRLSPKPILITETAAAPRAGKARALHALIAGVAADRLAGFVWFDVAQSGGPGRQDWRMETEPGVLRTFRTYIGTARRG
jgi:Glycosyl hydrolase family 26